MLKIFSIAHRRNKIPLIEEAIALGCSIIEFDVRDGGAFGPFLGHDKPRLVGGQTLLEDALSRIAQSEAALVAEIKDYNAAAETVQQIIQYDLKKRAVVASLDANIIGEVHRLAKIRNSTIKTAYLYQGDIGSQGLKRAIKAKSEWFGPHCSITTKGLVRDTHNCGLFICPWTVNEPDIASRLDSFGVDAIVTDNIALFGVV